MPFLSPSRNVSGFFSVLVVSRMLRRAVSYCGQKNMKWRVVSLVLLLQCGQIAELALFIR